MGPFPITRAGNRYIIVAVDYFSNLVLAQPVPSCAAGPSIKFLYDCVINRHGVPHHIVSDQGSAFTSAARRDTLSSLGIIHTLATTERPQTNGLVERQNAVIMDKLVAFVDKKESWDEGLQSSVFAINTDVHTATKFSPFEVVFGFSDEPLDLERRQAVYCSQKRCVLVHLTESTCSNNGTTRFRTRTRKCWPILIMSIANCRLYEIPGRMRRARHCCPFVCCLFSEL
jgi:hypothetical protein